MLRQFSFTSKKFKGSIKMMYKDGYLCFIDWRATDLQTDQYHLWLLNCPRTIKHLENRVGLSEGMLVVEEDYEIHFDLFWQAYNHKINRKRCEPIWAKLSQADKAAAYFGVEAYNKFLHANTWRKKADPEKYLKDRFWENEY